MLPNTTQQLTARWSNWSKWETNGYDSMQRQRNLMVGSVIVATEHQLKCGPESFFGRNRKSLLRLYAVETIGAQGYDMFYSRRTAQRVLENKFNQSINW